MTEPNDTTGTDTTGTDAAGEDAQVIWPAGPAEPDEATGSAPRNAAGDPAVVALLDRLGDLPELPVALHGEVYAGLHDDLLASLNEDVAGPAGGQPAGGRNTPGTTTETGDTTHEQA
ncbi:hypothetical protein [Arthrobacter sp. PsM3]|uniref:hypothetical protein n=1 Tax=Arthrobacter sp. PsM3 TaxID=3030531 RepID=UPI00263B058A|nr:hypothetical protein [Arthrobacter sp. PsM3]MDN4644095.1 hypothetical protein [Arthrobacter sp. PsM3]